MQLHARLGQALGDPLVRHWGAKPARHEPVMPPLDVSETIDAYVVTIDVPGMAKDEIDVTVNHGTLEIAGEAPPPVGGRGHAVLRAQRFRGPFKRVVPLPRQADFDSVTASLSEGVLTVSVGKMAVSRTVTVA